MIEKAQRHKLLRFFYAERRELLRSASAASPCVIYFRILWKMSNWKCKSILFTIENVRR